MPRNGNASSRSIPSPAVRQRMGDLWKRAEWWRQEAARCQAIGAERLAAHALENAAQCERAYRRLDT